MAYPTGTAGSGRGVKDNVLCSRKTRVISPMQRALRLLYSEIGRADYMAKWDR